MSTQTTHFEENGDGPLDHTALSDKFTELQAQAVILFCQFAGVPDGDVDADLFFQLRKTSFGHVAADIITEWRRAKGIGLRKHHIDDKAKRLVEVLESRELNGGRLEELNEALGKALKVVDA